MNIYLQNLALIQRRTSDLIFSQPNDLIFLYAPDLRGDRVHGDLGLQEHVVRNVLVREEEVHFVAEVVAIVSEHLAIHPCNTHQKTANLAVVVRRIGCQS